MKLRGEDVEEDEGRVWEESDDVEKEDEEDDDVENEVDDCEGYKGVAKGDGGKVD